MNASLVHREKRQDIPTTLPALLELWRTMTLQETKSIGADNWEELESLHDQKLRLLHALDLMPLQNRALVQPHLPLIRDLQAAERSNAALLDARLRALRQEIELVDQSTRALRGVRSAYGTGHEGLWQSYS